MPTPPAPVAQLQLAELNPEGELEGILCDIDDTLTHEGRLVPSAFAALSDAQAR